MAKIYICEDCKIQFDQKGHYTRHLNRKIPCILKDKPLKDIINEVVSKQVSKIIKEENKTIIISNINSNEEIDKTTKIKLTRKKPVKKEEIKNKVDYSYLRLPDNEILTQLEKEDNKVKSESKKNILRMIDKGHNYLYNSENIEGEDALNDIMNLLFIKFIQPIISDTDDDGKIDLLNKKYYNHLYDDEQLTEILSYFTDLKLLAKQPLDAIRKMTESIDIIRQMGEILKTHPITGQIFTENNFLKAKKAPTIQGLLNEVIIPLNIKEIEQNEDVIGEIYEHIINGYVKKGSKLGQFFTPRKLMKLIFNYKEDRINEIIKKLDKKDNIKFYDSCMGTGGWLVTGYNILKNKYKNRILLSGGEVKSTTFQYGLMNLILTLKHFPHDVQCESSLTHINHNKHHFILTNPPFQTDKKFDQIKENFKSDDLTKKNKIKLDDIYELKDNSPPIQFLELNIYKLEENGLCLIILPYGELFFGSSNKDVRKHFMKELNITDIILFPGGVFTHAGVKTCALIFEKDKKETQNINFIQANKECNILTKITTVSIDDIEKEPNLSWYLRDYLKDEYIEELSSKMTNFEWIEFGDIFTLEKGKLQSSKVEEDEDGEGVMVTQSKNSNDYKKIIEYKLDGENIFVGNIDSGRKFCIIFYNGKCDYTNLLSRLVINKKYIDKINLKYIYYYFQSLQEHLTDTYLKGSCNLSLDKKNLNRMKIPIPSLEEQEKINNKFNLLHDEIKIIKELQIISEKQLIEYFELCLYEYGEEIKKLSEVVCEFNTGKSFSSDYISESELYPSYGSNGIMDYVDKYIYDGEYILLGRTGSCGYVHYINGKFHAGDTVFVIKPSNFIKVKYLYYLLKLYKNNDIYALEGKGSVVGVINKTKLNELKLIIPSIENQESILKNLEIFENSLNNYIKNYNEKMKEITFKFNDVITIINKKNNIDKLIKLDDEIKIKTLKNKTKSKSIDI
jgi:type I restriction-modification system DNA methylase subunit/restriction endonuclease S subunit